MSDQEPGHKAPGSSPLLQAQAMNEPLDAPPPAQGEPSTDGAVHDGEPLSLAPGRVLAGRYTVLDMLGRGGMGVVVAAYDARLDRRVALKLLRSRENSMGKAAREARLAREAQAMARLSHPNVVHVYDAGTLEDGSFFISMEYVEGQTLQHWCQQEPRAWREVLAAYVAAGKGLDAAHAAGLIHRDFKPDNVLVGRDGRVRVTDFGLARSGSSPDEADAAPQAGALDLALTLSGEVIGTPRFMAPELLQGGAADVRSDLYAFCVALYEALLGQPPFASYSARFEGRMEPPSASSNVPGWVMRALQQGLQPEPLQRTASVGELLRALEDDPEVRRRARLRTWGLASGVAVLAVLLGVLVGTRVRQQELTCSHLDRTLAGIWDEQVKARVQQAMRGSGLGYAASTAERVTALLDGYAGAWVKMRTEVCQASQQQAGQPQSLLALREYCLERRRSRLRALTELLAQGPDRQLVPMAMQSVQSLPPLEDCADTKALVAAVPLPEEPRLRARVDSLQEQVDRLEALYTAGKHSEGLELGEQLLQQVEQVGHAPLQARALYWLARHQEGAGDYRTAEQRVRQALNLAARSQEHVLVARGWSLLLSLVGVRQARHEEALHLEPAVDVAVEMARDDRVHAEALIALGAVLAEVGQYEAAAQRQEHALTLREKLLGPEHPLVAVSLDNLGLTLWSTGRYEEARRRHERALAVGEKSLGAEHPFIAMVLSNLGHELMSLGRYEEAKQRHERARALWEQSLGAEHPFVAYSLNNLGLVLAQLGRYKESRQSHERAQALWERTLGPAHANVAYALTGLGRTLVRLKAWDEAESHLQRALALREKSLGSEHPELAETLLGLGELRLGQGRPSEAVPLLQRALGLTPASRRPEMQLELAQALWEVGQERSRALALALEAREYYQRLGHPRLADVSQWLTTHAL